MIRTKLFSGLSVLLLAVTALSADSPFTVNDAWVPATPPGARTAAAYFVLQNAGPADRIIAARSSIAARTELHTHVHADGMMRMQKLDGIDIAAESTLRFAPHGHHVMLIDLQDTPAPGDRIRITLTLRNAGELIVEATVRDLRS